MKTNIFFKNPAIVLAIMAVAAIFFVACSKISAESVDTKNITKDVPIDDEIRVYCYYYKVIGTDTCANPITGLNLGELCYIDLTCMQEYSEEPVEPITPPKGGDRAVILRLPNYAMGSEWLYGKFEQYFRDGRIVFTCDCPAGTPALMDYLTEGYLPAGTYPISKHGDEAWIDISAALQ